MYSVFMNLFLIPLFIFAGAFSGIFDAVVGGGNLFLISALGLSNLNALQAVATTQVISLIQTATAATIFEKNN